MNNNPLSVDISILLSLDKRKEMGLEIEQWCLNKGWNIKKFIVGRGKDKSLQYDFIDDDESPPQYPDSTNYGTWWKNGYNAWRSNKKIIQMCLNNEYESVMFLEDDIFLFRKKNLITLFKLIGFFPYIFSIKT